MSMPAARNTGNLEEEEEDQTEERQTTNGVAEENGHDEHDLQREVCFPTHLGNYW